MKNSISALKMLGFFTLVSATVLIFFFVKRSPDLTSEITQSESSTVNKKPKKIREMAEESLLLSQPNVRNQSDDHSKIDNIFSGEACDESNASTIIIGKSLTELQYALREDLSENQSVLNCLKIFGVEDSCLKSESVECENSILIARSKIIDSMTKNAPQEQLPGPVLANKIIAKVMVSGSNNNAIDIFQMSDNLLAQAPNNIEAHNIRAIFGIEAIRLGGDEKVADKGVESANYLITSARERDSYNGNLAKYGYGLADYVKNGSEAGLVTAIATGEHMVQTTPNDPTGYYVLLQAYGYQGDKEKALEWVNKGLALGKSQPFYEHYSKIKASIENGTWVKESLGLQLDGNKQFNAQDLLNN